MSLFLFLLLESHQDAGRARCDGEYPYAATDQPCQRAGTRGGHGRHDRLPLRVQGAVMIGEMHHAVRRIPFTLPIRARVPTRQFEPVTMETVVHIARDGDVRIPTRGLGGMRTLTAVRIVMQIHGQRGPRTIHGRVPGDRGRVEPVISGLVIPAGLPPVEPPAAQNGGGTCLPIGNIGHGHTGGEFTDSS